MPCNVALTSDEACINELANMSDFQCHLQSLAKSTSGTKIIVFASL